MKKVASTHIKKSVFLKLSSVTIPIIVLLVILFTGFKPQEEGQVYFLRSTNSVGSVIAYKVYIDDKLVCHLKNKHFSIHNVPAGEHTVSIQTGGIGSRKVSRPFKINVEASKSNYLLAVNGPDNYLVETVASSAQDLLKRLVNTMECLPTKATQDKN